MTCTNKCNDEKRGRCYARGRDPEGGIAFAVVITTARRRVQTASPRNRQKKRPPKWVAFSFVGKCDRFGHTHFRLSASILFCLILLVIVIPCILSAFFDSFDDTILIDIGRKKILEIYFPQHKMYGIE